MSETEREIVRAPGAIKRVTVAVLVNNTTTTNDAGEQVTEPRDEAEMQALRELVSSAVGYDEARGDIITIKSMALQSVPVDGTGAQTSLFGGIDIDLMSAIQMGILALVTLILGLFVVRPVLSRQAGPAPGPVAALPAAAPAETGDGASVLSGELADESYDLPNLQLGGESGGEFAPLSDLPMMGGGPSEDPVQRLRDMIGERHEETVEILRSWLEENEERA